MTKWLIVLLWVMLIGIYFKKAGYQTTESLISTNYSICRSSKIYSVILFSLPFIFIAFRTDFIDTASYLSFFRKMSTDFVDFDSTVGYKDGSELFYGLEFLFKKFISKEPQLFIFTIALVQSILVISTLRTYSEDLGMSVYLFLTMGMILSWMCNGMRQFTAVAVIFASTPLLLKKKWVPYIIILLLLSGINPIIRYFGWNSSVWLLGGIHQATLVFWPIVFITNGKALTKKVWIFLFALIVVLLLGLLDPFIEGASETTMYSEEVEYVRQDSGTNPIRVLVSSLPIIMVLLKYQEITSVEIPSVISLSINMSFASSILYLASAFSSGIYIGRLPIYCEIYNLILVPWLLNHPYKESKKIVSAGIILLYLVYFLYQIFIPWGSYEYTINMFGLKF